MSSGNVHSAVLVHAAWFDGSSWTQVIAALHRRGFRVGAVQLPLTSFADDVAALRRMLRRQREPLVLVGHSYGGAVMTAAGTGDANVKALVYVAAIVPDENETVGEVFTRAAPHPSAPSLNPDVDGLLWVTQADFRNAVAQDATEHEASIMAATQKPISVALPGREDDETRVAGEALVVPDRRKRSNGRARDTALPCQENEVDRRRDPL